MNNKGKFIKQAFILAVASLLVRLLGFLYRLPLTDMLGDEGNGIYSAGFYLYNFFLVLSSAGLPAAISKIISEKYSLKEYKNVKKVFYVSLKMSAIIGAFFSILLLISARQFSEFIGSPQSYYAILTLSPTVFIVSIMSVFRGYFQGIGTSTPTAMSQVIEQIFNAIFSIYLAYILIGIGIKFGAAGGTAGTGIGALAGLILIIGIYFNKRKSINKSLYSNVHDYKIESSKDISFKVLKTALPIITGTAIFSITNLIDMKMVTARLGVSGVFSDTEITSLYGQLTGKYVTITTLPVSISTALATAVLPSIASNMVKREYRIVKAKINTTLRFTMMVSVPAAFGIGILSDEILKLLFPNHSDGGVLLKWGAASIVFLALCQIVTGILQGIGKLQVPAKNALIGSLIKIPINYFLITIPSINVIGAIISTTVCYIIASLLNLRVLKKSLRLKINYKGIIFKPIVASSVMGLVCCYLNKLLFFITDNNTFSTVTAIFVGMFVYLIVLAMIKGFRREDLKLLPLGSKIAKILEKFNLID